MGIASVTPRISAAHIHAMLHCTGWFDVCLNTTIHNWNTIMTETDDYTRDAAKLIIGPWSHGGEFHSAYGAYDFGLENDGAGQDMNGKMLSWFDYHIKGKQNNVPGWGQGALLCAGEQSMAPRKCLASQRSGSHTPSTCAAMAAWIRKRPQPMKHPTAIPTIPWIPPPAYMPGKEGHFDPLPDYAPLGKRADVITYETAPLTEPVTLAGTVTMQLFAVTSGKTIPISHAALWMCIPTDGSLSWHWG